jgi:hypothetical protein
MVYGKSLVPTNHVVDAALYLHAPSDVQNMQVCSDVSGILWIIELTRLYIEIPFRLFLSLL